MNIQSFFLPDTVSVKSGLLVPIQPGLWAMVIGVRWAGTLNTVATFQPFCEIVENTFPSHSLIAVGNPVAQATSPSYNGSGMLGLNGASSTGVATGNTSPVALGRYPIERDFTVNVGHNNMNALDTISGARVVVAFAHLVELLSLF